MSKSDWWQTEENDSVATKRELWQPFADALGGFDLDPAAGCEPTPIAGERYTEADDGLTSPWFGKVWLNPPFSDKGTWYKRLVDQYWNGDVTHAVAIAQVGTDADWFQEWFSTADIITFVNGRGCYHEKGSENFASMVGVWKPNDKAIDVARSLGTVVEPYEKDPNQAELFE